MARTHLTFSPLFLIASALFASVPPWTNQAEAKNGVTPKPVSISMNSRDWEILYSTGMPRRPTQNTLNSWYFDFPNILKGHVHYILQTVSGYIQGTALSMDVIVTTSGATNFEYKTEPENTCIFPAYARFYLEKEFSNADYVRWWANPKGVELAPGFVRYTVALDPAEWTDTWGHFGNSSAQAIAGFNSTLAKPRRVGLTFGGGYFFGHGVGVSGGTARFEAVNIRID